VAALDRAIARVAQRHGGHVNHRQLGELGLTEREIRHRVKVGRLIPVYRGVYAVGHLPTHPLDRARGALLAAGPGSALSHSSAAVLLAIYDRWRHPLEVVTPGDRRPRGLIVHRSRLLPSDLLRVEGVLSTNRARTLLDVTPQMTDARLLRAVNGQRIDHGLRLSAVEDVLRRFPRYPGARRLRAIVFGAPKEPFRSGWEIEWPPYAAENGLPRYEMNYVIRGCRVDVYFTVERLIVELDGWGTHGTKAAFEKDRDTRNAILAETGIPTFAITYTQFHERGAEQARRLHLILARRRRELAA
jgi:hypothetical protein